MHGNSIDELRGFGFRLCDSSESLLGYQYLITVTTYFRA